MRANIRLYIDQPLGNGQSCAISREQAHYLGVVMRVKNGAQISVFNGKDGEWLAQVIDLQKKSGVLRCIELRKAQEAPQDLWLLFAPLKKTRTDFVIEKAAELGVARICPVQTRYTNSERIRRERMQLQAIEAAEQCGATFVPKVDELEKLESIVENWPVGRHLLYCDETAAGAFGAKKQLPAAPAAILVGPEGGFAPSERAALSALPYTTVLDLGPRILRAETAAIAALVLWQAQSGDWQ